MFAGAKAFLSGAKAGRGAATAGARVGRGAAGASKASRLRAAAAARGSRLAEAGFGSRTAIFKTGLLGAGLFAIGDLYSDVTQPFKNMSECSSDPFEGSEKVGPFNAKCGSFLVIAGGFLLFGTIILIFYSIYKYFEVKKVQGIIDSAHGKGIYGKSGKQPKGFDLKYSDPGTYEPPDLDYKFGGGKKNKLMNVNILLVIFIGYLLFYLYERYSEMINKDKELNKFRRN